MKHCKEVALNIAKKAFIIDKNGQKKSRKLNRICKIFSKWPVFSLHCHTIVEPDNKRKCPGLNSIADSIFCLMNLLLILQKKPCIIDKNNQKNVKTHRKLLHYIIRSYKEKKVHVLDLTLWKFNSRFSIMFW